MEDALQALGLFQQLGIAELVIILLIALLIFGPKRLPELAKSLGRAVQEFRRQVTGAFRGPKHRPKP
ncbi:MAG: twin-arginine translocase TatA/TatE family subunit [Candidatus Omnitrophica bacterium]|nr:twin-arginine translocase TatA/TatE family subunit [Candidatus Omnitrophota bacterium]